MMSFRTRERDLFGVFDRAFDAQVAAFAFCILHSSFFISSRPLSAFSISGFQPFSVSAVSGLWSHFRFQHFSFSAFQLLSVQFLLSSVLSAFQHFSFSAFPWP
jgi:hypothetical protein